MQGHHCCPSPKGFEALSGGFGFCKTVAAFCLSLELCCRKREAELCSSSVVWKPIWKGVTWRSFVCEQSRESLFDFLSYLHTQEVTLHFAISLPQGARKKRNKHQRNQGMRQKQQTWAARQCHFDFRTFPQDQPQQSSGCDDTLVLPHATQGCLC